MRWRYEDGIGEERAALFDDDGVILEARIEPDTSRLRLGLIADARAVRLEAGRYAIVEFAGHEGIHEAIVDPRPRDWTEGQAVRVEVVREALAEPGVTKRARVRQTVDPPRPAPTLREEIGASGLPVDVSPARQGLVFDEDDDRDVRGEAMGGPIRFDVGQLHVEMTRAMTLIDVDGWADPVTLAVRAASIAARTVRRLGIGGSIGIDFPTGSRDARARAAEAFDAGLPKPFERTAVNGFGFMQVVRPRRRPSLPELYRDDPTGSAARMAVQRAQQSGLHGATRIVAAPAVVEHLNARPDWLARLARELGGAVALRADPSSPIWASHVERA